MLFRLNDEVKIVMEATGIYHLPVLTYLQEKGFFVSVINPYLMKSYRNESLRKAKTDKIDSRIIANYGIDHWFKMKEFQTSGEIYEELKLLGQQYRHYMKLHLLSLAELTHLLDLTMPGIKNLLQVGMKQYGKNLEILGKIYPDARIGLVVPDYVDIHSIDQLNANKEKFGGEIIGIDAGAGIMHAADMAIEKYNLDYKLLESSGPAMTAVLKRAIDEHQWIVVTGWTPHWMFTRFKLNF